MSQRISFIVTGKVQGVGFRMFTKSRANELGLTGFVENAAHGGVEGEAQGPSDKIQTLIDALQQGPRGSRVDKLEQNDRDLHEGERSFVVRH
ncbi:Acylphosphatase [Exidia glandulosa HHB12029]|uniref:acylphosphatase n=1 Tax=Exidia glandulosa HHB12029 TaxID=1314781 RepID=A0A165IS09_EXIGL|nr:Acylphosphatase [Exidia glandulosa HHB12029]